MAKIKVGMEFNTNKCGVVRVVEYVSCSNVIVEFLNTGNVLKTRADKLKSGNLKDKLAPTVYGVGYIGEGLPKGFSKSRTYKIWNSMLQRCYDSAFLANRPTYCGCTVSENFKSFQYFSNWCENQVGFNSKGFQLDKDILSGDVKHYSEDTCVFIPAAINSFVREKPKNCLGATGVYQNKGSSSFYVRVGFGGAEKTLKFFKSERLAKEYYESQKMEYAKKLVDTWSGLVDTRVIKFLSDMGGLK